MAKEGAKLITVKSFSVTSLKNKMLSAWFLTREVFFCPIGDNMFMVQAFCLGVWKGIRREVTKAGYEALPTNNGAAPMRSAASPNELPQLELSRTRQRHDN